MPQRKHRFQAPPSQDPLSGAKSSLVFRLNFGFFFRQLVIFLVMDLLLAAMARLREFYPVPYEVEAITLDMGHADGLPGMDFSGIAAFCKELDVPYTILNSEIQHIIFDLRKEKNPCSLCAKLRRGALHTAAQELGCNKIALGHHMSDVLETTLLGLFYGAQLQTMPPKLHSKNFPGMELIRPLYLIREDDIKHWRDYNDLHFIQCACKFTDTCTTCNNEENQSKRMEIKKLIAELKKTNPFVEGNIFKSVENVNLDTVVGYKAKGVRHNFLDTYDD